MCLSVQAPVFISFFIALRKMAYLPVPSFQTGGLLWFPDLTAADPFYLLPLAVTGTMFFILEVRDFSPKQWIDFSLWQTVRCIHVFSECLPLFSWVQSLVLTIPTCELWRLCSGSCLLSSSLSRSTSPRSVCCSLSSLYSLLLTTCWNTLTRHILNWLHSLAHLLFEIPFLSSNKFQAVFTYWFTSNCFSLGQVALLRHPLIRDRLRIPEKIKHPSSAMPQNEGFIESMKKGEHPHRHSVLVLLKGLIDLILEKLWGQRIYICSPRLEKCSAGPTAGGKGKEDQKSPGSSSQRSV